MWTGQQRWSFCAMRNTKHGVAIFGIVDLLASLELPEQLSPLRLNMPTNALDGENLKLRLLPMPMAHSCSSETCRHWETIDLW